MKRKLEEGPGETDPPRPVKRLSMLHNTPKQWKEQRRKILSISKQKLKAIDDVDSDLLRSVLINNTYRKMKRELKQNGCSPPSTWVPKPVFASARGRALMSQMEWEREREVVAMEIQADDIKSKVLCPPLTDLSQVLSDILGEHVDTHPTTSSSEQDVIDKLCNQGEQVQTTSLERGMSTQCYEAGTHSTLVVVSACSERSEGFTESTVVSSHRLSNHGDASNADLIKCVQQETEIETGLGDMNGVNKSPASTIDCGVNDTTIEQQQKSITGGIVIEVSGQYERDSDKEMTSNDRCVDSEGLSANCVDPQGQGEVMDCCRDDELMHRTNNSSALSSEKTEESDKVSGDCDLEDSILTTNAMEDFVISPKGLDWSQKMLAASKDGHGYLNATTLPLFTCPSLITAKQHELVEFSSSIASLHNVKHNNNLGSNSNPSQQNQPTDNHQLTSEDLPEREGLHMSDRMDITCSLTQGAASDFLQPQYNNNHKDKLSIRDSLASGVDTEVPAANSNCDLDINQHIWACFQQFNMAIACS